MRCIQSRRLGRPPRGRRRGAHHGRRAASARRAASPAPRVRTAFLCRDKPAMKEALREARRPVRAVDRRVVDPTEVARVRRARRLPARSSSRATAPAPRAPTASTTTGRAAAARAEPACRQGAVGRRRGVHRGPRGLLRHDQPSTARSCTTSSTHYYPNVLEAMRTRWISPQFITTNRIDARRRYDEVKAMGQKVIERARHRHLGDAHGVVLRAQGPEVLRDRLPPAGRPRVGPLRRRQRDRHLPRVGASPSCTAGRRSSRRAASPPASSRCAPSATAASPATTGSTRCSAQFGEWIIDAPPPAARHAARSPSRPATWRTPGCA